MEEVGSPSCWVGPEGAQHTIDTVDSTSTLKRNTPRLTPVSNVLLGLPCVASHCRGFQQRCNAVISAATALFHGLAANVQAGNQFGSRRRLLLYSCFSLLHVGRVP